MRTAAACMTAGMVVAALGATVHATTYNYAGRFCRPAPLAWASTVDYSYGSLPVANASTNARLTVYCPIIVDPTPLGIQAITVNVLVGNTGPVTCTFNGFDGNGGFQATSSGSSNQFNMGASDGVISLNGNHSANGVIVCDLPPFNYLEPAVVSYTVSN